MARTSDLERKFQARLEESRVRVRDASHLIEMDYNTQYEKAHKLGGAVQILVWFQDYLQGNAGQEERDRYALAIKQELSQIEPLFSEAMNNLQSIRQTRGGLLAK